MIVEYLNKEHTILKISILLNLIQDAIQQEILQSQHTVVFRNHSFCYC